MNSVKKNKKPDFFDIVIKALIVLCVAAAVALFGLLAVEMFSGDKKSVDDSDDKTSQADVSDTTDIGQLHTDSIQNTTEGQTDSQVQVTVEQTGEPETTEAETSEKVDFEPETSVSVEPSGTLWAEEDRIIVNPEQELWNLVVVNGTRAMPEGYKPQLDYVAGTDVQMDYRVAPYYTAMYNAAKEDGITLTPYSGYRSYDRQKRNYNNLTETYMSRYNLSREEAAVKAATVILPPGTSEHNLGLAMDICNTYDSFANQKEYAWLMEHAHEYGFILRYTADKQDITGIVPEPWHWRFVGVEYAEEIKNSGLCLEEWLTSKGIAY